MSFYFQLVASSTSYRSIAGVPCIYLFRFFSFSWSITTVVVSNDIFDFSFFFFINASIVRFIPFFISLLIFSFPTSVSVLVQRGTVVPFVSFLFDFVLLLPRYLYRAFFRNHARDRQERECARVWKRVKEGKRGRKKVRLLCMRVNAKKEN